VPGEGDGELTLYASQDDRLFIPTLRVIDHRKFEIACDAMTGNGHESREVGAS
jgi:hypothetical protein